MFRAILATVGAVLLLASSAAHAFVGGPALSRELSNAGAGADLVHTVMAGWYFGSVCMLVFGLIAAWHAGDFWRRSNRSTAGLMLVGLGYLGFGLGAYLTSGGHPHFLGFMGIGAVVGLAGWPRMGANGRPS